MEKTAEFITKVGLHSLGRYDGCACTNFSIRGICVDIACRKSSGSDWDGAPGFHGNIVRVYRDHDDVNPSELEEVAKAVTAEMYDGSRSLVRYCKYENDRDCKCEYCGKPRETTAYVCTACETDKYGKEYDYRRIEFIEHEPVD